MIQPAGVLLFCLKLLTIHGVGLSDDGVIQDENVKPLKIDLKSLDVRSSQACKVLASNEYQGLSIFYRHVTRNATSEDHSRSRHEFARNYGSFA